MRVLIPMSLCLCSVPAMAADFVTEVVPRQDDVAWFDRGVRTVSRESETLVFLVRGVEEFYGRPAIQVAVVNKSDRPVDFGETDVTIHEIGAKKPVLVYAYEDLRKQAKNKAMWQRIAGALQTQNAGQSTHSGSIHGSHGGSATYSGTTHNNYAQMQAERQVREEVDASLTQRTVNMQSLALRRSTIMPEQAHGGMVVFSKPTIKRPVRLKVVVQIGSVREEFDAILND